MVVPTASFGMAPRLPARFIVVFIALAFAVGCAGVHQPDLGGDDAGPAPGPDLGLPEVFIPEVGHPTFEASPDLPPDPDACSDPASCMVGCGNGKLDPGLDEACDDGNSLSMDGCSAAMIRLISGRDGSPRSTPRAGK